MAPNGGKIQSSTSTAKPDINPTATGNAKSGVSTNVAGENRWNCAMTTGALTAQTQAVSAVACHNQRQLHRANFSCQGRGRAIRRSSGSALWRKTQRGPNQTKAAIARNDNCGPTRNSSAGFHHKTQSAASARALNAGSLRHQYRATQTKSTTTVARAAGGSASITNA